MQKYNYKKENFGFYPTVENLFSCCDRFNGVTLFSSDEIEVLALEPIITVDELSLSIKNVKTALPIEPLSYVDNFIHEHNYIHPKISFIGHISYDAKYLFEEKGLYTINKQNDTPLLQFTLYNVYIFFNKEESSIEVHYIDDTNIEAILQQLSVTDVSQFYANILLEKDSHYLGSSNNKKQFSQNVTSVIDHIKEGDVYQLNLSREISVTTAYSAVELAIKLYHSNNIEYGVFQKIDDSYIISTSPELFFKVKGVAIITSPIKGTISTQENDAVNKLITSKKEISELAMIVDLLRNDISRICKVGSVKVGEFPSIIELRNVFHAYCDVHGELAIEISLQKIMKAMFPGGSISGCPKIKACQIIEELEKRARGIYTGTFGYYNFNREMVFNILIRTVLYHKGDVKFSVGGGITVLSNPEAEFDETVFKADTIWRALNIPFVEGERDCIKE